MNKHLRIFLCSVISVLMIFALAIAGCTTTTTTSTSSDSSTTVSDSTGTESTGSDSTGSGDSTTGDSSGSGDSSETHVHDYDYANYELVLSDDMSEATVIVPCTGCDESLTVTASITSEVKTAATNLAKGVTTYTASFTLDGVDYTIPVDVDTPALATVYDTYYINNVESSVAGIELFDGFATATGGYWSNTQSATIAEGGIAEGYVFQGRILFSNRYSLSFTLEEDATVTIYALISYNGNTVVTDENGDVVFSTTATTSDNNEVKALEMDLDAGTYTITNDSTGSVNTTIYAFMLQDSGKTSVYTEGLWQPAAEEEPDEPVTPDEPIDEDVSSVPETLAIGDNTITVSAKDSSGEGEEVTSTFTAEEAGTYTFAISANEDGYVYVGDRTRTLSASGTTSVDVEMTAGQTITLTFFTDSMATATYTLNISSAAVASGTFELETETDYTFTAPIAGTYTFTLSGDTETATIWAGEDEYNTAWVPTYLDVQSDGTTTFTVDLTEGQSVVFFLAGSDGVTVSYTTGSATSGGDEGGSGTVTETSIPDPLTTGDNAISITASDAAKETASGYYTNYGVSATYTAPENGYYTFSIGASDEYAYVTVIYDTYRYVLSSTSTTTAEMYADGIYIEGGAAVTIYFSTLDATGNTVSASYTFTISYVAGTSSLVYPTELTIGGTTEVVMDNSKYVDIYGTTTADGVYTISIPTYDDLSEVAIAIYLNDVYYVTLSASNNYTVEFEATSGTSINFYARISSDSSAVASYTISVTYVEQEIEIYSLTVNAYVLGSTTSDLTPTNGSATDVAIKEGKSIYLKAATPRPTYDYNFVLTISDLTNLTILASTEKDSSDSTMAADGSYTIAINASAFTANSDGTYSYSFTLDANSQVYFMVTASADVTIDVSIVYGGEGGTLGGDTSGDEDTHTYTELAKDVTTDITWDGESSAYVVYYSYTSTAAGTGTLTLTSNHAWGVSSNGMYSYFTTMFTVTVNGETITGSNLVYTFDIVADTNYIVVTFSGSSSMVTGYTYTALLAVEEKAVDPTEGYTELTANKTTEITWDGESNAYTVSYYYSASEATTATLTLGSNHAWADPTSTMGAMMYSTFTEMFTVTVNGETVTGSDLVYTLSLTEGYNYIVISFTGSSSMVDGYTYTVNLAITDTSHVHSYTIENWTWNDDYSATLDSLECDGCDEVITVNGTATVTSEVTQVASCDTHGEKVYTATYTYDGVTYTTIKTVSTDYAHSLTYYEYKAPTASENGHLEYWYCSICEKYFSDAEGDTEVEYSELVLTYNTSSTLYNMSATGLTTSTYLYADDTIFDDEFSVASTSTSTSSTFSIKYASISDYVVADGVDTTYKGTTVDFSGAVYNFTATRGLSFTITQSAKVTIWYGLGHRNSSYNLYITTGYGSASAVTSGAVASFAYDTNVADYVNNYYKYVLEGSATLSAGTYYLTTNATSSSTAATYIYAIAIDYDLSGVTISGETEVTAGNSITLTAAATLADGSASSDAIVWTTSDSSIATVDNGVVTGVAAGTVTITATAGNVSASCTITVTAPVTVTAVTVTGDTTATVGDTLNLTYTVTMSDGSAFTGTVTWATSDSSIATVANGVVTAIAAGEVTITATADGVYGTITITVEKAPAAAMVAGETYSVDLTTTDTYVETSITITEAGYYTVTVSANGIISISDSSSTYYYNNMNCYLGYIIDYAAADEVAIKVEAGTILSVYISLYDPDTAGTVTATIALDANYNEGGSGDSGDSGEVTASGSFELATETDYTFTATEAGTYTFTISGDADYACVYAGYASYENWKSALLDVQSDYSYSFTYDLAAGETLTLYLTGSNGATVTWSVGTSSGDDEGGETDVSVVPTLEIGDNTIYITAADSSADGVTVTFTATGEGDYTFSATGDAWVEVGAYKATVSGSVSQTLTLTEGEVVTITFYTYSYDAATYTFTIAYTAAETASYTAMSFAGEDDVTSGWAYWNDQWWYGSGVTVSEAKYAENDDGTYTVVFAISSDENSNCTFGFQLFYNDTTNYTVGSTYTLTATITSDIDVTVKFNDKEYTLTAGNAQDISVEFIYKGDAGISLFDFQYAISGAITANVTISNIKWTAATSGDDSGSTEATTVEYSYNFSNIFTSDDVSSLSGSFTGSSDTETTYYFTESSYTTTAAEGTDYVLTYTTAKTNDKIASTSITDEDGTTYSYAVQPNGSTTGSNLRYFTIDLSEYAGTGKTVTIEIIGTSKTGAQIVLASGATDTSTTNAYAYNTAAESDYATVDVVSYTGTVSSTGLYYITFASQSSRIYAINITVSDATAAE